MARKGSVLSRKQGKDVDDADQDIDNEDDAFEDDLDFNASADDPDIEDDLDEDEGSEEDGLVEIDVDGKVLKVSPDAAEVLAQKQSDYQDQLDHMQKLLDELTNKEPVDKADKADDIDYTAKFFEDPERALSERDERITKKVKEDIARETKERETLANFWKEFYKTNDDLVGDELIVDAVLSKNVKSLGRLSDTKVGPELAKLTRQELIRITGKSRKTGSEDRSSTLEGGSSTKRSAKKPKADEVNKPVVTIAQMLQARRKARRSGKSATAT